MKTRLDWVISIILVIFVLAVGFGAIPRDAENTQVLSRNDPYPGPELTATPGQPYPGPVVQPTAVSTKPKPKKVEPTQVVEPTKRYRPTNAPTEAY